MTEARFDRWLSLSEASEMLGVHASTLRRWADSGRVACQRTPGGHRRFNMRHLRPLIQGPEADSPRDIDLSQVVDQPWHGLFVAAGLVDELRQLGQRLSGIMIQYLMRDGADQRLLDEGLSVGRTYASRCRSASIDVMPALHAFLFFRTNLADVAARMHTGESGANRWPYTRYDEFMSQVLLGLVGGYDDALNGHG